MSNHGSNHGWSSAQVIHGNHDYARNPRKHAITGAITAITPIAITKMIVLKDACLRDCSSLRAGANAVARSATAVYTSRRAIRSDCARVRGALCSASLSRGEAHPVHLVARVPRPLLRRRISRTSLGERSALLPHGGARRVGVVVRLGGFGELTGPNWERVFRSQSDPERAS